MSTKQVIVVRKDLSMRKGKIAAQVAHASLAFIANRLSYDIIRSRPVTYRTRVHGLTEVEVGWLEDSYTKVVLGVDSEDELLELASQAARQGVAVWPIVDNGRTEFGGVATLTCVAFGPDYNDKIDAVTGHLALI